MGMFSDLLGDVTIAVKSPDGNIEFELERARNVVMGFAPGTYRRYAEPLLGRQLAGLFTSLWVAHRRAHLAALSRLVGYPVRGDSPHGDQQSRGFVREREKLRLEAYSTSGRIRLASTGMQRWVTQVKPGTVRQLTEDEFLNDLWCAFTALMNDYHRQVAILKRDMLNAPIRTR